MIGFALDMDGTIYHGERPIPGARGFIEGLKERGIPFRFVTNNSSHTRQFYADRLNRMGFDVTPREVLTSTVATVRFIKENYPGKSVYAVATPDVTEEISSSGICLVKEGEMPDVVLLTYDRSITYEKINNAYQFLLRGSEFVATHPDNVCPTESGYDIDLGPFIRMFEGMVQKKAVIVGKPNRLMLDMAALEMGVRSEDVIMVGDRMTTDIRMAVDAGTRSILVLSGETDRDILERSGIVPTYVLDSVGDILGNPEITALLKNIKS